MRKSVLVFLASLLVLAPLAAQASGPGIESSAVSPSATTEGDDVLSLEGQATGALAASSPLFIENMGQFADGARFLMRGGTGTVWLAEDAIWITVIEKDEGGRMKDEEALHPSSLILPPSRKAVHLKLSFVGANPHSRLEPFARLETKVSYFIGADPAQWHADVPVWGGVRYVDLYPGIDLVMGKDEVGGLKDEGGLPPSSFIPHPFPWRLVVKEGAELGAVRLRIEGAEEVSLPSLQIEGSDTEGQDALHPSLLLTTALGEFSLPLLTVEGPEPDGEARLLALGLNPQTQTPKPGTFEVSSPFALGGDEAQGEGPRLLAGPSDLLYGTFLGGSLDDDGFGIAVDGARQAYVSGRTYSTNFPAASGPGYDPSYNGTTDAFVVKLNASGTGLLYATFLGGSSYERGNGIAVDGARQAYVTGETASANFPAASGPGYDPSHNGGYYDAFVVKLNASGTGLLYATFLGGSENDMGSGIAVDGAGQAYVTGQTASTNFPAASGPGYDTSFNGRYDAYVVKLNVAGTGLLYATFLGGSENDWGYAIAVDGAGQAYITGETGSTNFPAASGPGYDTSFNGGTNDAFVVKLSVAGTGLRYATFLGGGSFDGGNGIAVDGAGQAYVSGRTYSTNFPAASGPGYDTSLNGTSDAFVVKLNASGTGLLYATFLGGGNDDGGYGIAVDGAGQAYVTGYTYSTDFPAAFGPGYDPSHNGDRDGFVAKLNASGTGLLYATFLGGSENDMGFGIAVDGAGQAYVTGYTASTNFPAASGPGYDTSFNGLTDAFVLKLATVAPPFAPPARWIAAYGTSAGDWTSQDKYPRTVADVNADGRADVVGFANDGVYVSLSTGTAFGASSRWIAKFGYSATAGGWTSQNLYPRMVADVNRNGKADVVGFFADGVYVSLSTGTGFTAPTRWIANFGTTAGGWASQDKYPRVVADVNGDGQADIVGFGNAGVYVSLSTGTGFSAPTRWIAAYGYSAGGWTSQDKHPRCVADVNGDGKADVVGFANDGVYVSLSTGTSFGASTRWIAGFGYSAGGWTSQDLYPRTLADVNGDSAADIIGFGNAGAYVSLSTSTSFAPPTLGIAKYGRSAAAGSWTSQNLYPRAVADVNHDHKADIVGFASSGAYVSLSQ